MLKFTHFLTFKEFQEKSGFLEFAAQALEAGDFLNIFLILWSFEA